MNQTQISVIIVICWYQHCSKVGYIFTSKVIQTLVLEDFTASPTAYFLELAGSEEIPPPIEKLIPPVLMGAHLNIEAGGPSTSNSSTSTVADSWKSQCKSMIDNLICTHLANQQTSLRSHIDDLCTIMQKGEFGSPGDFKDALKEALNEEGSDMGKKERVSSQKKLVVSNG